MTSGLVQHDCSTMDHRSPRGFDSSMNGGAGSRLQYGVGDVHATVFAHVVPHVADRLKFVSQPVGAVHRSRHSQDCSSEWRTRPPCTTESH